MTVMSAAYPGASRPSRSPSPPVSAARGGVALQRGQAVDRLVVVRRPRSGWRGGRRRRDRRHPLTRVIAGHRPVGAERERPPRTPAERASGTPGRTGHRRVAATSCPTVGVSHIMCWACIEATTPCAAKRGRSLGLDRLDVLDAVPDAGRRPGAGVGVQRLAHAAIAGGVGDALKARATRRTAPRGGSGRRRARTTRTGVLGCRARRASRCRSRSPRR